MIMMLTDKATTASVNVNIPIPIPTEQMSLVVEATCVNILVGNL